MLTGKGIIDDVLTVAPNGGAALRSRILAWANIVAQSLAAERPWLFLQKSPVLAPVDNEIELPADFGELQCIHGGAFLLTRGDKMTDGEAFLADKEGGAAPKGYSESIGKLKLHGGSVSHPVTVTYTAEPAAFTDTTAATVWPSQCKALFHRTLLTAYYEFDFDERQMTSLQLDQAELYRLKKWDNRQKPIPKTSAKGYRRVR